MFLVDLRLLVHAEHDRRLPLGHVQADDVAHLLAEQGVIRGRPTSHRPFPRSRRPAHPALHPGEGTADWAIGEQKRALIQEAVAGRIGRSRRRRVSTGRIPGSAMCSCSTS